MNTDWVMLSFFCLFPTAGPGGETDTARQERRKTGDTDEKERALLMSSHAFASIVLKFNIFLVPVHEVVDLNPK